MPENRSLSLEEAARMLTLPFPVCSRTAACCAGRSCRSYCRRPGRDSPDALFARGRVCPGLKGMEYRTHPAGLRSADPSRPAAAFALAGGYRILLPRARSGSRISTPPTPTRPTSATGCGMHSSPSWKNTTRASRNPCCGPHKPCKATMRLCRKYWNPLGKKSSSRAGRGLGGI